MGRYIGRRLLHSLPTIFIPLVLVFFLLRLAPGDPAVQILGDNATPEQIAALRDQLGLNQPLPIQFLLWLKGLFTLQLGDSLFFHKPVLELIPAYAAVTLQITILALLISLVIGLSAGIAAALLRGKIFDRGIVAATVFSVSLPEFWLALVLIFIFAVSLRWFPVAGYVTFDEGIGASLATLALPALAIGIRQAALLTRMTRSAMLDVLDEPYVTTARAQGLPERTVIGRYAFRTASVPIVTIVGLAVSYLLSGAVAIEIIFSLPGMGKLLVDAVSRRDYPVVEGSVLTIAIILVVVNLAVDLLYAALDPRIRLK